MLEREFQRLVIELAEGSGWLVYHVANVRGQLRCASSVGFPDLILVKDRVITWECKRKGRKATDEQQKWIDSFRQVGIESRVITEEDFDYIIEVLGCDNIGVITRFRIALEQTRQDIKNRKGK